MEIFEHLPKYLKSLYNNDVPKSIQERLKYQWKAAHEVISTNVSISMGLSRNFSELVLQYGVDLPKSIRERLCTSCNVLLIPTLTCHVRLRKRSARSKINKKCGSSGANQPRYKNELVIHCNICKEISYSLPCHPRPTPSLPLAQNVNPNSTHNIISKDHIPISTPLKTSISSSNGNKTDMSKKRPFSFLNQLVTSENRRTSAPGRLPHQLSSSSPSTSKSNISTTRNTPMKTYQKPVAITNSQCVTVTSTTTLSSPDTFNKIYKKDQQLLLQSTIPPLTFTDIAPLPTINCHDRETETATNTSITSPYNLVEMEKLHKKQRRKSSTLHAISSPGNYSAPLIDNNLLATSSTTRFSNCNISTSVTSNNTSSNCNNLADIRNLMSFMHKKKVPF